MKSIKAIVLTYDKYRSVTDHMIIRYNSLWPKHPFVFRVPFQNATPTLNNNVEYIQTPSDIKGTVLALISDLDDEELIYWCIDDKYPITLDVQKIEKIYEGLVNENNETCADAVLFCRCRDMLKEANLFKDKSQHFAGYVIRERRNYNQIWIHQFLKVKVIRALFNAFPDEINPAKVMDDWKDKLDKPAEHRLFVTKDNFAVFGESTTRGHLTKNCYKSMNKYNVTLPDWISEVTEKEIIMGDEQVGDGYESTVTSLFRKLKKRFA
jgi:hypothetical protein